jgi:hypothetical protein
LEKYDENIINRIRGGARSEFLNDLIDKKGKIFLTTDFQPPEK